MSAEKVEYHAGPNMSQSYPRWTIGDPIHTFSTLESTIDHFLEARDIAWGGNYYRFCFSGEVNLVVRLDEILSASMMKELYKLKKTELKKFKKFIDRDPYWTDTEKYSYSNWLLKLLDIPTGIKDPR